MAELIVGIVGIAVTAAQLAPVLYDVCERFTSSTRELKPIARNIEVLSTLLRALADVLNKDDAMYPLPIRECAQGISDDCGDTCNELKDLISRMERRRSARVLKSGKLSRLQTRLESQKSTLSVTITLANLTTVVLDR
jgi:hypothetical protein